jgi:hypothetical protein
VHVLHVVNVLFVLYVEVVIELAHVDLVAPGVGQGLKEIADVGVIWSPKLATPLALLIRESQGHDTIGPSEMVDAASSFTVE